jgi:hypothetical protein
MEEKVVHRPIHPPSMVSTGHEGKQCGTESGAVPSNFNIPVETHDVNRRARNGTRMTLIAKNRTRDANAGERTNGQTGLELTRTPSAARPQLGETAKQPARELVVKNVAMAEL